ncbi:MAG TPA: glucans biosynthesis glucosyltransferase MdoH [Desulfobulbaceae bacterium]|nr:glucans biosynthesis glucosyltransferase MdoH [Desulfobulbaceae bacterium]
MADFYPQKEWEAAAGRRRLLLFILIAVTTFFASGFMADILPYQGRSGLEMTLVVFFALLFSWISIGFWTAAIGFVILWRRYDRFAITRSLQDEEQLPVEGRTAILIPVYNEQPDRVFAGVKAVYLSLAAEKAHEKFDYYVLSDTTDPDIWIHEELAWARLCHEVSGFGRIFYRHRRPNIKRKSGNIADFCRRWGRNYRYMVVFDADSMMTGSTVARMVRLMERNPRIGILQTTPLTVGKKSLLARIQQFASHAYGPMFAAGLHYWQIGDAQYWGHNAVIRIAPFMAHCGLPRLSGKPPLGGDILSHDFVEAALMRGAGFEVWLAYDLTGSWEEPPPTLIDELGRDRRWCQGNLQHMRLLLAKRIFPTHRVLFLNGAMSYVSALLWFLFLNISSIKALSQAIIGPDYFPVQGGLFPEWPIWNLGWALVLLTSTFVILLLPKLLSAILIIFKQKRAADFGGPVRLLLSLGAEIIASTLLAPLRMLSHSKFVFVTLLGQNISWKPPPREDQDTAWDVALRFHGWGMALALIWGGVLFLVNRPFFWWLVPVLGPLILAVPLSVWTSRKSLGKLTAKFGLFLIPEELSPPPELLSAGAATRPPLPTDNAGFVLAVVDPYVNALHLAFRRQRRKVAKGIALSRHQLVLKALAGGPDGLRREDKVTLLSDPDSLDQLHALVWQIPDSQAARLWGLDSSPSVCPEDTLQLSSF